MRRRRGLRGRPSSRAPADAVALLGETCGRPVLPCEAKSGGTCQDRSVNVWANDWVDNDPEGRSRRLADGNALGATLYELSRGGGIAYHFHHGSEELLVVLRGRLRLRTPAGTRDACTGDVVHFPVGPEGAHAMTNEEDEPVRYMMVSTRVSPDATEYPDTRQLSVYGRTKNQFGEKLFDIRTLDEP
jgi:uncharacterized cupin superfamily protein